MPVIKGIFVAQEGLLHDIIGGVVKAATDSRFVHAAIGLDLGEGEVIVEAIAPRVMISSADKYDNAPILEVIKVPVTNEQYDRAVLVARSLVGLYYGLDDCIVGGINDIFGKEAGALADIVFDWEGSLNCSALYTLIFRAMFFDFLEGREASTITPQVAFDGTMDLLVKVSGGTAYTIIQS